MNLILFEPGELEAPLPRSDPRAVHLLRVLRRREGDLFDAGIVDGPRGKATLAAIHEDALILGFEPGAPPMQADLIHLLIAVPRPQTARKILNEASTLGVASMHFFTSQKGEPSYASSTLWKSGEWRRHLKEGAAQAFDTRLPGVLHHGSLDDALSALPQDGARIALDNYEATHRLVPDARRPISLAFGPERGWSDAERTLLRRHGFGIAHLGERVLRTETAVAASLSILKASG